MGVHPANEYLFVVFVTPVGPYFKGGFSTNPYVIIREFDVPHLMEPDALRWAATMLPACVPIRKPMIWDIPVSSI